MYEYRNAASENSAGKTMLPGVGATVTSGVSLRFRLVAGLQTRILGPGVAQPTNVVRAPDQSVWVVDGGDLGNLRGQLVRVSPRAPAGSISMQ